LQFELGCFYIFHTEDDEQTYTLLNECDEEDVNVMELNGKGQLQIYPNPSSDTLNIEMPENMSGDYTYTVVNIQGKVMGKGLLNRDQTTINVKDYSTGKYVLTLQNGESLIRGHFMLTK